MGWQSDAAIGVAQRLNDTGVGVWSPDDSTGTIYRGPLPQDVAPGIGVQTYRVRPDDPQNPTAELRLQLWLRAPSIAELDDLDTAAYDALQGLHAVTWGTVVLTDCGSLSSVPMGLDGNGNYERSCNYVLQLDLPETALRSY